MVICRDCGHHNDDKDMFCGSCGHFLEWTGEKVQVKVAEELVQEAEAESAAPRPGLLRRIRDKAVGAVFVPMMTTDASLHGQKVDAAAPGAAKPSGAGGPPKPPGAGGPPGGPPKPPGPGGPPGLGGPPKPPGLGGPPKPPGLGGPPMPPAPPGMDGPPKPPGMDGPPRPPGMGGPPKPPGMDGPPKPPGMGGPPKPPGMDGPPRPPGMGGPPRPPGMDGPPAPPTVTDDPTDQTDEQTDDQTEAAQALVAPVDKAPELPDATTDEESTSDGELVPQAAKPKPPAISKRPPTRKLGPGDLVCGECGEGNKPTRKFCSRCGESLATAQPVRTKWWRKLLPRRRKAKVMAAGTRPSGPNKGKGRTAVRTIGRKIKAAILTIILTGGMLVGFYPPARTFMVNQVTAVKQKLLGVADQALSPIHPASVKGNIAVKGHGAKLAMDEYKNTYWLAPWSRSKHPILTIRLDHKVVLKKLIVINGASGAFIAHERPRGLHLSYSNEKSEPVVLKDTSKQQEISLHEGGAVDVVQIEVTAIFPAQGAKDMALTEIELFGIG